MPTKNTKTATDRIRPGKEKFSFRAKISKRMQKTAVSVLEEILTGQLELEYESLKTKAELMATANAPLRALLENDRKAVKADNKLNEILKSEHKLFGETFHGQQTHTYNVDIKIHAGLDFVTPPYDLAWGNGASDQFSTNKSNGVFTASNLGGNSGAGLGVFLTSPVRALVRFSPFGPFTYSWLNAPSPAGPAASSGGVGIMAFRNQDKDPFWDKRQTLWSDQRARPQWAAQDHGDGTFGRELDSNNLIIHMQAGDTVLVWMWCWVSALLAVKPGVSVGSVNCAVPYIVIETPPPF